jgi:pantoate--beta-alanine ligase
VKVFTDLGQWHDWRAGLGDHALGFVPTMGALHAGHQSLMHRSVAENAKTVLSIYLNATQFNDPKDLAAYPATLDADLQVAEQAGVDAVLLPTYEQIYPDDFHFQVDETELSQGLCGADRPGHFTGVLTVVMKLLNIVGASKAYFGLKDYQQYQLIQDMSAAFFLPVQIIGCDTVREADGLAMSSRNRLLDGCARAKAGEFNKILHHAASDAAAVTQLQALGARVDYEETRAGRRFGAIVLRSGDGEVRLIDNCAPPRAADVVR